MAFVSATELVVMLRQEPARARDEIERICGKRLQSLMAIAKQKYVLPYDLRLLTLVVGRWLEMFLVSQPDSVLAGLAPKVTDDMSAAATSDGWEDQFAAFVLVNVFRSILYGPAVLLKDRQSTIGSLLPKNSLPASDAISFQIAGGSLETRWLRLPLEWVSGDIAEGRLKDGTFWVIVADATGHGWLAYVVAQGVSCLWKALLESSCSASPSILFEQLDRHLHEILPEGMFIEAILCHFDSERFSVAAAGVCRIIVFQPHAKSVEMHSFGDLYLGMGVTQREDKQFVLPPGAELALASDGLYEQPVGDGPLFQVLLHHIERIMPVSSLYEALTQVVQNAIHSHSQTDDISIVTIRQEARGGAKS